MTLPNIEGADPMTPNAPLQNPASTQGALRRFLGNPLGVVALILLLLIIAAVTFAGAIASAPPNLGSLSDVLAPPSANHPLGADGAGRDTLSRLLWGGQVSLLGAAIALLVAMLVGVPTGLLAGYHAGWFDSLSGWFSSMVMALPAIIVLLAVRAVVGPSIWVSMAIFGVILSPSFYRLIRAAVKNVRGELYVDAARVAGLSDSRIIARHISTVVRGPIIIQAALIGGIAIAVQSGLEFLGIGDPDVPTWGGMLNEGFRNIYSTPLMLLWPALAIGLTCASLGVLGNSLRDALEDRNVAPRSAASRANRTPANVSKLPASANDALLCIDGLEISYPRGDEMNTVVRGVDLVVRRGEIVGLVGESGSGKTQTAFATLGLLPAGGSVTGGSIWFEGIEISSLPKKQRRALRGRAISYIPQEPMSNLDPNFTVGSQLVKPLRAVMGLTPTQAKSRALELLSKVGIPDPARTFAAYPHQISGGMAQRVLIAGAVSCEPRLLIADEPTTALDVTVQAEVLDLIRQLQQELDMGVLMVTHNFGVVADICDRVAVMRAGEIVEEASVLSIFNEPRHPYTQKLLASTLEDAPLRASINGGQS